jgi:FPC/CPF motif-containing protein YcgG
MTIDQIKSLLKTITPHPWYNDFSTKSIRPAFESSAFSRGNFVIARYPTRTQQSLLSHEEWEANAEFLSKAPQIVQFLLNELEKKTD